VFEGVYDRRVRQLRDVLDAVLSTAG
jgi:hypothetical protein